MIIKTGRFGQLSVDNDAVVLIPQGILGFPELKKFCLVDPGDDTLILWLQSLDQPDVTFPVLEPKIFKPDYAVRLSAAELRELKLENVNQSAVFGILTIPEDISKMTANLKAPIVINLKDQLGKQVVLQENEYGIRHEMFKELKSHLVTIESHKRQESQRIAESVQASAKSGSIMSPVPIRNIPPSLTVKSLQV